MKTKTKTKKQKIKSPILVNAEEMHRRKPESFWIPESRNDLQVGDSVKVSSDYERFWVTVLSVENGIIVGEVDNMVLFGDLEYKDRIRFAPCNVYQVMRGREYLN